MPDQINSSRKKEFSNAIMQIWKITDNAQNYYYEDIGDLAMMSDDRSNIIKIIK